MKYVVKLGLGEAPTMMTMAGAKRYAAKMLAPSLKKAGFVAFVSVVPTWLSGAETEYLRVNYGKKV